MTHHISIKEAASLLGDYLDRVAEQGDRVVLLRGENPIAELRPLSSRRLGDLPQLLASLPHLTREEADAFAEDLARAKSDLPPANLWES